MKDNLVIVLMLCVCYLPTYKGVRYALLKKLIQNPKYSIVTNAIFVPLNFIQSTHSRVLNDIHYGDLNYSEIFFFNLTAQGKNHKVGLLRAFIPVKRHTPCICDGSPIATNKWLQHSTCLYIGCLLYVSNRCTSHLSTVKVAF